jgi:hypothetical protein
MLGVTKQTHVNTPHRLKSYAHNDLQQTGAFSHKTPNKSGIGIRVFSQASDVSLRKTIYKTKLKFVYTSSSKENFRDLFYAAIGF